MFDVARSVPDHVPLGHLVHVADPTADHDPAVQLTHAAMDVAPSSGCAVPASHDVQLRAPAADHAPGAHRSVHAVWDARGL